MLPPPEVPALLRLGDVLLTLGDVLRLGLEVGAFCTLREFEDELRILSENDLVPLPPLVPVRVSKRLDEELLLRL